MKRRGLLQGNGLAARGQIEPASTRCVPTCARPCASAPSNLIASARISLVITGDQAVVTEESPGLNCTTGNRRALVPTRAHWSSPAAHLKFGGIVVSHYRSPVSYEIH